MSDIKDILRQRNGLGLTLDGIAAATEVSAGTVSHVLERASAAGLTWPPPDDLDEPMIADSVLDRIVHNACRKGMRCCSI